MRASFVHLSGLIRKAVPSSTSMIRFVDDCVRMLMPCVSLNAGQPGFSLKIDADIAGMASVRKDPRFGPHIDHLVQFLTSWTADCGPVEYADNFGEIVKALSSDS